MQQQQVEPIEIRPSRPLAVGKQRAADALGLHLSSLDRLLNRGQLPAIRVGGRVLIPWQALCDFVSGGGTSK